MIVFFEVSAHPAHNGPRVSSALTVLDNLICSLSMSVLDRNDQRASQFGSRTVPIVSAVPDHHPPRNGSWSPPVSVLLSAAPSLSPTIRHPLGTRTESPNTSLVISANAPSCVCNALTLGHNWRYANDLTPLWLMTPAWAPDASDPEIRKEECRRVVWSSVTLVAGYTSYVASLNAMPQLRLSLMDASNVCVLSNDCVHNALTRRMGICSLPCYFLEKRSHQRFHPILLFRANTAASQPFGRCTCASCFCGTAVSACAGTLIRATPVKLNLR